MCRYIDLIKSYSIVKNWDIVSMSVNSLALVLNNSLNYCIFITIVTLSNLKISLKNLSIFKDSLRLDCTEALFTLKKKSILTWLV